jgi:hypothetical protein
VKNLSDILIGFCSVINSDVDNHLSIHCIKQLQFSVFKFFKNIICESTNPGFSDYFVKILFYGFQWMLRVCCHEFSSLRRLWMGSRFIVFPIVWFIHSHFLGTLTLFLAFLLEYIYVKVCGDKGYFFRNWQIMQNC